MAFYDISRFSIILHIILYVCKKMFLYLVLKRSMIQLIKLWKNDLIWSIYNIIQSFDNIWIRISIQICNNKNNTIYNYNKNIIFRMFNDKNNNTFYILEQIYEYIINIYLYIYIFNELKKILI